MPNYNFVDYNGNPIELELRSTNSSDGLMSYEDKVKLNSIETGATKTIVDATLSSTSTNPVQNKVINTALNSKASNNNATTTTAGLMSGEDKTKLNSIETGATKIIVDTVLSSTSLNPVQNKVINTALDNKADNINATTTVAGLMSAADKVKLDGIASGATKTIIDTALNSTSTNPVQNKVINTALGNKANSSDLTAHINNKSNPHGITLAQVGAAAASHNHSAANITSGTLAVARGGTGTTTTSGILSAIGLACSARGNATSVTLPADAITKVTLNTFTTRTDTTVFEFSNNGVKLNRAGTIIVSGNVYITLTQNNTTAGCYVYKGTTEIISQFITQYASGSLSSGAKILNVVAGDIIYLHARSYIASTIYPNIESTCLNIAYIK